MKKYLMAASMITLSLGHNAIAQGYDKDNDHAQMIQDTRTYAESSTMPSVVKPETTVQSAATVEPAAGYAGKQDTEYDPGFYIGGYGGYEWSDVDIDNASADVSGGDYGLFIGAELEAIMNGWMGLTGAIEGFYGWSEADDTVNTAGTRVNVEKNHEWGVNIRPGLTFINKYAPLDMKPYGILGYRRANFETSSAGSSSDKNYNGFELGVGSELVAYDNFGIRLDYSHVFYKEKNNIDPDEDDLRLGMAYHF